MSRRLTKIGATDNRQRRDHACSQDRPTHGAVHIFGGPWKGLVGPGAVVCDSGTLGAEAAEFLAWITTVPRHTPSPTDDKL